MKRLGLAFLVALAACESPTDSKPSAFDGIWDLITTDGRTLPTTKVAVSPVAIDSSTTYRVSMTIVVGSGATYSDSSLYVTWDLRTTPHRRYELNELVTESFPVVRARSDTLQLGVLPVGSLPRMTFVRAGNNLVRVGIPQVWQRR